MVTLVLGAMLLGGAGYSVTSGLGLGEKHSTVFVTAVDEESDDLTFDVPHERVYAGGDTYTFRPDVGATELIAILRAAYPSGSVVDDGTRFTVVHDGTLLDVAAVDGRTWTAKRTTAPAPDRG